MVAQFRVSRRYVLGVTAAVGGLAVSGGIARGQSGPRIEKLAPELDKIISTSDPVQHLADGFGGPLGPAEGPVWWKEGHYLLFSDIRACRSDADDNIVGKAHPAASLARLDPACRLVRRDDCPTHPLGRIKRSRECHGASSTYARLRAMGAVISALMPPAFAITSRRCVRPQPAKVSARPSSLAVLLPDARDCRWQNYWPVAPRGNCRGPAAGFQGVEANSAPLPAGLTPQRRKRPLRDQCNTAVLGVLRS